MTSVVSKNLYELLGNDPELDPNREPAPPTKVIDKPVQRAGKRNGAPEAPVKDSAPAPRGGRREQFSGSEQAARDKNAGSANNRSKPVDDGLRRDRHPDRIRDSNDRPRGSRGGRGQGRAPRGDRHDRSGVAAPHTHEKQAAHGWGGETGDAEWSDEKAGLADARAEEKEGIVADSTAPVNADGEPVPELEDKTKSYEQYLAEQLEKKAALGGGSLAPRKANEGSSKKFPEGKALAREGAEEDFISGTAGKAKRDRERKTKEVVDIDLSWKEEQAERAERAERAPRGGARGGRGRGGPRGGPRGGARGGDRPERAERTERAPRAPRGGAGASPNVTSAQDFPSLS